MSVFSFFRSAAALAMLLAAFVASASVGLIQFSAGDVKIRNAAGQLRDAAKGGAVDEGDTILTAAASSAQLKMADGGIIAVRPETELKVDTYRYAGKEDGTERAVMSLVKGGFRTITGLIGRTNKQNYTISTPTAVIGIRGTDHEPIVIPAIAGAGKPVAPPGTYDKVNVGQAYIKTPLGEVNIRQNQVGYAAPNQAPTLLPKVPDMFRATPPVRQAQAEKKDDKQEQQKQQTASSRTSSGSQTTSSGEKSDTQGTQTAGGGSPDSGSSSSTSTTGTASTSSSTSSTSDVRATAAVDSMPTTASTGNVATTTTVVATATVAPAVTTAMTTTAPPAVVQEVKGKSSDDSAATLNLTTQTTTTSSGATSTLQDTVATKAPTISSTTYGSVIMSQAPVDVTTDNLENVSARQQANTEYALDQTNALVEVKHTGHVRTNNQGVVQRIADANLKFSGGKAADIFVDDTSTMYIGRQEGGNIRVTDNSGAQSAFTQSLNSSSAHWLLAVQPGQAALPGGTGTISNVQNVIGTASYVLKSATHPTDLKGNVGTLTNPLFIVDFSSQTILGVLGVKFSTAPTDPVAVSKRDFELAAVASNVPIRLGGFEAVAGTANAPTVACVSGDCVGTSYRGTIRGMFGAAGTSSGGVGTSLGIGYSFAPEAGTATRFTDLVQGAAILTAAGGPPTIGTKKVVANDSSTLHELFYGTYQAGSSTNANLALARDTVTLTNPTTQQLTGVRSSSNYLYDASGNLVRVFDTPYVIFSHGDNVTATTTGFTAPTPIAHAQVSMGSVDATSADFFEDGTLGLRMGRWKGGNVNVTDLSTGAAYIEDLGDRSAHWLVRAAPTSLPVSGVYHYTKVAATQPTDLYGNVGTLDRARLTVDFNRSTVSAGVSITMPTGAAGAKGGQSLTGYFSDAPITSSGFNVSSNPADNAANTDNLHVNCRGTGCAASQTYGGRIRGGFSSGSGTSGTAEGAYFRYSFTTNYATAAAADAQGRVFDDYIDGFVAFKQGSEIAKPIVDIMGQIISPVPTVKPPADATIVYAYNYLNNSVLQTRTDAFFSKGGSGYEVDAQGNLLNATGLFDNDKGVTGTNAASSAVQKATVGSGGSAFDIRYGFYAQPTVSGNESGTSFSPRVADTFQWIRGPAIYPFYLSMITDNPSNMSTSLFTVGYAKLGGMVTDGAGAAGTIDSAGLAVNFNRQTVDASVKGSVGVNSFDAVANRIALEDLGSFWATQKGPTQHNFAATGSKLLFNGSSSGVSGTIQGALMGPGLQGAGFVFDFISASARAMGSVVLGNPTYTDTSNATTAFTPSPLSDYHLGMVVSGMNKVGALTNSSGSIISQQNNYRIDIGALPPNRVQFVDYQTANASSPAWALTKFDGAYPFGYGTGTSSSCSASVCTGVTEIGARYAIMDATGGGPLPANSSSIPAPTAKALEAYYDAATGMRWGRWGGGMVNVGDRASGGTGTVPNADGTGGVNQIDLTANNWHYLLTGVQSGPVVLPISGTVAYQLIGGTSPTSYTPGQTAALVGTLSNATLTANFTAKTVDVGVNLRIGATDTWSANATGVAILKDTAFSVDKVLGSTAGKLAVTRGVDTVNTAGKIVGGFAGQTGQGAGIAYSLNQGGASGTTVSGVAAFKRP